MINSRSTKVSIAVVTYNSMPYVITAIDSILASTYKNIEIIICDDCSTDGTWEAIQSYQDDRIIKKRNETNLGEYSNRNQCIEIGTGEYLIFIDGDDYLYPHGIETILKIIGNNYDFGFAVMRPYHNKIIYPAYITPRQIYLSEFLGDGLINVAFTHTIFKLSILKENKLSTEFIAGDTYIRLSIGKHHNCLLINDNLGWWRNRKGQAYEKLKYNYYKDFFLMTEKLFSNYCPLSDHEKRLAINNIKILYFKTLLMQVRAINIAGFFETINRTPFSILQLYKGLFKPFKIDTLKEFSPENPLNIKTVSVK